MVQPADGLGLALLAAQDEGEEEGGLGLAAVVGLGDRDLADVLVVAGPGRQRHERGGEPVARGLDHQLLADLAGRGLRDVADVEGLQKTDAGAADHLVVAELALQVRLEGADLGLGALDVGGALGLLDVLLELTAQLGQLVLGTAQLAVDDIDILANRREIAVDDGNLPINPLNSVDDGSYVNMAVCHERSFRWVQRCGRRIGYAGVPSAVTGTISPSE